VEDDDDDDGGRRRRRRRCHSYGHCHGSHFTSQLQLLLLSVMYIQCRTGSPILNPCLFDPLTISRAESKNGRKNEGLPIHRRPRSPLAPDRPGARQRRRLPPASGKQKGSSLRGPVGPVPAFRIVRKEVRRAGSRRHPISEQRSARLGATSYSSLEAFLGDTAGQWGKTRRRKR
jgi:hypothetical protein